MFFKFISLEWKAFTRSASFNTNLFIKIVMGFIGLYLASVFSFLGYYSYEILRDLNMDPIQTMNKYLFYYVFFDLIIRFLFQKLPVTHIKTLLSLPIAKRKIASYTLAKSFQSFYVWVHPFLLIPLCFRMITEGLDIHSSILWTASIFLFLASNNLLNILLQNKKPVFIGIAVFAVTTLAIHRFTEWDYLEYFRIFFELFYSIPWFILLIASAFILLSYVTYQTYLKNLYLDQGMSISSSDSNKWQWVDNLSTKDPFLQNDVRLILRNKRSKSTLFISLLFLGYGLLLFKDININDTFKAVSFLLPSIIITGGFILTFGQYVPSWDSSYYPLLMSQNIKYKAYLESKWRIMVIGGLVTSLLSMMYLFKDLQLIYPLLAASLYNLGINSQFALLTGAYIRTPIDLSQNKNIFGDRKSFSIHTVLISLPMFVIPVFVFIGVSKLTTPILGYISIGVIGALGYLFKSFIFKKIEKLYKRHKYITLNAYKQSN